MSGGEYLLGLILIITGLAISDLVVSLHGVLINRAKVRWDWLAMLAAAYIFLMIVNSWGIAFRAYSHDDSNPPLWEFLELLGQIIPLYLAARAALPDECNEETDLAAHYAHISRYFWTAVATTLVLYFIGVTFGRGTLLPTIEANLGAAAQLALIIPLVIWKGRRLHALIVPLIMIVFCIDHLTQPMFG